MFLSAEAKRSAGNGIKPIERAPLKSCCLPDSCTALASVPSVESAGRDPQARRYFVSGRLPEVRSKDQSAKAIRKRSGRGTRENKARAAKQALAIVQSVFQEE